MVCIRSYTLVVKFEQSMRNNNWVVGLKDCLNYCGNSKHGFSPTILHGKDNEIFFLHETPLLSPNIGSLPLNWGILH